MKLVRKLLASYEAYHEHGPLLLRYFSVLGVIAFPPLYLLKYTRATPTYDDLWLRLLDLGLMLGLLARQRWPARLERFYLPYSWLVITVCLPLTLVFTSFKNGGGPGAIANTFMAVFFVVLLA